MSKKTLPSLTDLGLDMSVDPKSINWQTDTLNDEQACVLSVKAADETNPNTVSIYGPIGGYDPGSGSDNTMKRIAGALRHIGKKDIVVNINSPGGDYFEGLGIYSLLREHPGSVTVDILGMAGSAASVIAMAGDTIRIGAAGFIMVHNASAVIMGNKFDVQQGLELLNDVDASMAKLYSIRTQRGIEQVNAWMDNNRGDGTMFMGENAVGVGMADSLLPSDAGVVQSSAAKKQQTSLSMIDNALAKEGLTRSQRRDIIKELFTGKPGATHEEAMPSAGDESELVALVRRLIQTIERK